jgi:hypothetical protein
MTSRHTVRTAHAVSNETALWRHVALFEPLKQSRKRPRYYVTSHCSNRSSSLERDRVMTSRHTVRTTQAVSNETELWRHATLFEPLKQSRTRPSYNVTSYCSNRSSSLEWERVMTSRHAVRTAQTVFSPISVGLFHRPATNSNNLVDIIEKLYHLMLIIKDFGWVVANCRREYEFCACIWSAEYGDKFYLM